MKNLRFSGDKVMFTAAADVSAGGGVLLGSGGLFGISSGDVLSGETGTANLNGVYELPKTTADTPSEFATAYWDDTNKSVTTTSTSNTKIGVFTAAYGNGDTLAEVLLIPAI